MNVGRAVSLEGGMQTFVRLFTPRSPAFARNEARVSIGWALPVEKGNTRKGRAFEREID